MISKDGKTVRLKMRPPINFKAIVWNLVPIWVLVVAAMWLHLQQLQVNSVSLFQNSIAVSAANASFSQNRTCLGLTECWDVLCQLQQMPGLDFIRLQFSPSYLNVCFANTYQAPINTSSAGLFSLSNLLVMLALFIELINLAVGAIAIGLPYPIIEWIRYGLIAGSLLLMEAAYIVEVILRLQLQSLQTPSLLNWSLGLNGVMMATVLLASLGATIARRSVQTDDWDSYSRLD